MIIDSKKLKYGFKVISAGVPSFFCFGIRGRSYSSLLASTVQLGNIKTKHVRTFICMCMNRYKYIYTKHIT